MTSRLQRLMVWALAAAGAAFVFAAWLSPESAFSFVTLASLCG